MAGKKTIKKKGPQPPTARQLALAAQRQADADAAAAAAASDPNAGANADPNPNAGQQGADQPQLPQPPANQNTTGTGRTGGRVTIAGLQAQMQEQQEQARQQQEIAAQQLAILQGQLQQAMSSAPSAQQSQPSLPVVAPADVTMPTGPAQPAHESQRVAELEAQLAELRASQQQAPAGYASVAPPFGQVQQPFATAPGYPAGAYPAAQHFPMGMMGAPAFPQGLPSAMQGGMQMTGTNAWMGSLPSGGEYDIARHYTALPVGKLEKIMMGDINLTDIYQAIPSDSVLYPMVDTTDQGGLKYDPDTQQFTMVDASFAQQREKNLKRLAKTLDHPMKFALAWSWFVCLTNYKYQDPGLNSAMMRFGWKVISYSMTNPWATVLRVFVQLATPLLTGSLLSVKGDFDNVSFSEALGPYRHNTTGQPIISPFSNVVANPSTSPAEATTGSVASASKTGAASGQSATPREMPVCQRWNQGKCNGAGCRFRHVCTQCNANHPQMICPLQPSAYATPPAFLGTATHASAVPYGGFGNPQQTFNPGYVGYPPMPNNQPYGGQPGYNGQMGYGAQQGFPQQGGGYNQQAQNQQGGGGKPRAYGPNQQGKGAQA